jgi:hypothetical protein
VHLTFFEYPPLRAVLTDRRAANVAANEEDACDPDSTRVDISSWLHMPRIVADPHAIRASRRR